MHLATLLIAWTGLTTADPAPPINILDTVEARRISATLSYSVHYDQVRAREWVVFVPQAPDLPGQEKVESRWDLGGTLVKELSPLKRPLMMSRIAVRSKELENGIGLSVTYTATLRSRRLKVLPPGAVGPEIKPLVETVCEPALAALGEIDCKSDPFQRWLTERKLHRRGDETDLAFARRVFLDIRLAFQYEYRDGMDRRVSAICKLDKTDCAGLSNLFVAALRANRVPSRTLYGRWAKSADPGETLGGVPYYQAHVKAELFADGIGWVPVDLASAIRHDRSREGLAYFGNDPGDFLTLHIDPSLELDTRLVGRKTASCLQLPAYWVKGPGRFEGETVKQAWEVKKVP